MTRDEINQADADALNRLAATAIMGWYEFNDHYYRTRATEELKPIASWRPSTDANDAATCVSKIEERGLQEKFVHSLWLVLCKDKPMKAGGYAELWRIAKATPEQITRACLLAVCGE
jgi:hypothetical protein